MWILSFLDDTHVSGAHKNYWAGGVSVVLCGDGLDAQLAEDLGHEYDGLEPSHVLTEAESASREEAIFVSVGC